MTFSLKKHSPEIFLIVGLAGVGASAVLACVATTKLAPVTEGAKEEIDAVREAADCAEDEAQEEVETDKKAIVRVYAKAGVEIAKLYAPSLMLGGLSVGCILVSHDILKKRNVALGAAFATLCQDFKEYRGRVVERFGEKTDTLLKYGAKEIEIDTVEIDAETGEEKQGKATAIVVDPNLKSAYACYFDNRSRNFERNSDYNMMFLRAQEQFANDRLMANKYLFLNDVLTELDLPVTKAGQIVGWRYNPDQPTGDNQVKFRILEVVRELEDGSCEPAILLDFNVDGNIWEDFTAEG